MDDLQIGEVVAQPISSGVGGALPRMLLPFNLFAGGRVGSGRQYWPWIHLDDWVELMRWAIVTTGLSGPVNATAPKIP